jgi:hypothetical protein
MSVLSLHNTKQHIVKIVNAKQKTGNESVKGHDTRQVTSLSNLEFELIRYKFINLSWGG